MTSTASGQTVTQFIECYQTGSLFDIDMKRLVRNDGESGLKIILEVLKN
jgi:hypothetical protein